MGGMHEAIRYERPEIVDLGSIGDHTFTTPMGAVKGCTEDCHLDKFNENSANAVSPLFG